MPVSSLDFDFDFDVQMVTLEHEWRQVYEASMNARADYQSLSASKGATAELLDIAREKLDRAEAMKARIMTKIERLEDSLLGQD
jgi:hypothetical protein